MPPSSPSARFTLPSGDAESPAPAAEAPSGGLADRLRSGREQLTGQAGEKARGLVTQGLERTAEALANVSQDGRRHRDRHR